MISCFSSNINTEKSLGNRINQNEKGHPSTNCDNSNDSSNSSDNNYISKTQSTSPNGNPLPEKNKNSSSDQTSNNNTSSNSNAQNSEEVLFYCKQESQKNPQILSENCAHGSNNPQTPSKNAETTSYPEKYTDIKSISSAVPTPLQASRFGLESPVPLSDEEEDDSEPEIRCLRSNSFRDIKSMQPRGYGKMGHADLTKYDTDNAIENVNSNYNEADSTISDETMDTPKNIARMLEDLKRRNAATWKLLGYDPTHGKGDMRGSATLANFSPMKLIRESKLWEEARRGQGSVSHSNANTNSTMPKQVMQSYSLCIKPAYRAIKRVNSSNGPLSNLVEENGAEQDDNDKKVGRKMSPFENQFNDDKTSSPFSGQFELQRGKNNTKNDDDFIPPSIMTAESLLNGPDVFKDDDSEEYLVVEEEEEEEEFIEEEEEEEKQDEVTQQQSPEVNNSNSKKEGEERLLDDKIDQKMTDFAKPKKK